MNPRPGSRACGPPFWASFGHVPHCPLLSSRALGISVNPKRVHGTSTLVVITARSILGRVEKQTGWQAHVLRLEPSYVPSGSISEVTRSGPSVL